MINSASREAAATALAQAKALSKGGDNAQAVAVLRAARALAPDDGPLLRALGEALFRMGSYAEAVEPLAAACATDPKDATSAFTLGAAAYRLRRYDIALPHLKAAIALDPTFEEAYRVLAMLFRDGGNLPAAIGWLDTARERGIVSGRLEGLSFYLRQMAADWSRFDAQVAQLREFADRTDGGIDPAIAHSIPGFTALDHRRVSKAFGTRLLGHLNWPRVGFAVPRQERIRVGYLSADFYDHPVGRHLVGILESHDRAKVEVYGLSLGPDQDSATAARLRAACDRFEDLRNTADDWAARRVRELGVEILVDLTGYTEGGRLGIVAQRAAPIQVLYLGQGGTSGHTFHDYFLADSTTVPPQHMADYSETLAYLPEGLFNIDHRDTAAISALDRAQCDLPIDSFVFCAFNNTWKVTPQVFGVWMDILKSVPQSVLWMRKYYPGSSQRLGAEAAARGIDPARLRFANGVSREEHLARLATADLYLDTFPYGAGSTAADALWAGVPLLTCTGESYVSRMAASQLVAMGVGELAATNLTDYRAQAIGLAKDPARLKSLRDRIAMNKHRSSLFDSRRFTAQLERVYAEMSRQFREGVWPRRPILDVT
jgi:hypothetical protein